MIVTCMLIFSISLDTVYLPAKKPDAFNTIKLKIGLSYPLRNTLVVKGKILREQTKKT